MEESIRLAFGLPLKQLESYSPLSLAYIGDAVYELIIRQNIVTTCDSGTKLNTKKGSSLAKAVTQAKMMKYLLDADNVLSEEEVAVFKRGRNANNTHKAKNASTSEYRYATGFEALIGYLYLQDKNDRIYELIKLSWENYDR